MADIEGQGIEIQFDPQVVRVSYRQAAKDFVHVVSEISPEMYARPALGSWNVIELIAHTSKSLTTIDHFLNGYKENDVRINSAAAYYIAAFARPGAHAGIEQRAREGVEELGKDVPEKISTWAAAAFATVDANDDTAEVKHWTGTMTLIDYLGTKVVEFVVHTGDLRVACGLEGESPRPAATLAAMILAQIGVKSDADQLLRGLTGRESFPDDYNVLG